MCPGVTATHRSREVRVELKRVRRQRIATRVDVRYAGGRRYRCGFGDFELRFDGLSIRRGEDGPEVNARCEGKSGTEHQLTRRGGVRSGELRNISSFRTCVDCEHARPARCRFGPGLPVTHMKTAAIQVDGGGK